MRQSVFYIDPESYANLSAYDYNLLSNVKCEIMYFCSTLYDHIPMGDHVRPVPVFSYNKMSSNLLKGISYIWSYLTIFTYIIRYKPQVIHVQWLRLQTFDYLFYSMVSRLFKVRLILTAHNVLPLRTGMQYFHIYNRIYHLMDRIITHTENSRKEIMHLFNLSEEKIYVVPHGLLKLKISDEDMKNEMEMFRSTYPIEGKIVLSSLGFQTTYKGIDTLIKVWAETAELNQNPSCILILAGKFVDVDVNPTTSLKNVIIQNRRISNEELYYLLKHTDIYLLPYREISQSGAMLTAVTESVPILVTDIGGLAEPLSIAKIGWSIPRLGQEALRNTLVYLVNNPDEIASAKNNKYGWQKVKDFYAWETIGAKTLQIYFDE